MKSGQAAEILIEEQVLSQAEIAALFPNSVALTTLISRGIFMPDRNGSLRVSFVGVAVAGGRSFQILPKIFSKASDNPTLVMRQVIRALRRYERWKPERHETIPYLDPNSRETDLNAIAIADWLMRDYLTSGIYRRLREREEVNGSGQVSWRRTVERTTPIMTMGRPIYLECITKSASKDYGHFISRLHRQIVEAASQEFGHLLGYASIALDHEPFEPFQELPSLLLCQVRIRQEMHEAYSDRAMRLLPMMLAWLLAKDKATEIDFALYGTRTFYRVWEEACSLALGNERNRWQDHIPRPEWRSAAGNIQTANTFEPDIVTRIQIGNEQHLLIADAKYYQLSMPPALHGNPSVNDIAKQLWYERCLTAVARDRGLPKSHNIFVVPGPEREECFWSDGEVSLKGLDETTVKVKRLSGLRALERYADGTPLDKMRVHAVIVEQ